MKILIADDHPIFRSGIRHILREAWATAEIDEVAGLRDLIERLQRQRYDLVITDLTLPDGSGFEALRRVQAQDSPTPVLVVSMHAESEFALQALKAGAKGYLAKDRAGTDLMDAVHTILAGRFYIGSNLAHKLAEVTVGNQDLAPHELLSQREFSVMQALANGSSIVDIAQTMNLSPKTVSTYRLRLLKKLGMDNNADMIRYCLARGLVA
jgi:DNA-binding NarL/FixJ family response regulator